jgi:simple sugar transport system permease protein
LAAGGAGLAFAIACVYGRGDQIVIGTAFNLLAAGALPTILKSLYDVSGSTPALPLELRFASPWPFAALAVALALALRFLFSATRHGLRIDAAGENPQALVTQGASFRLVRVRAVVEGALIAGVGGAYLSLCQGSGYTRDMSAGRGFIALAALIFGNWRPVPTLLACLFFGLTDAIQIQLQGHSWNGVAIPSQFIQIIPYLATLIALVAFSRRIAPPAAINRDAGADF